MKIGLYSPYFPKHLGGGEKYLLDVAQVLQQYGQVYLATGSQSLSPTNTKKIWQKYERFMGKKLTGLELIQSPLFEQSSLNDRLSWSKQFDLLYAFTDGSLFANLAKKSVLHIQTPLKRAPLSFAEKLKSLTWNFVNTNSDFTRRVVEKHWHLPVSAVHYPMVDVAQFEKLAAGAKKQKVILHVGRFFRQLHSKRQDALVKFFRELIKKHPKESKGWQLVLIGSVEDENYAKEVAKLAKGRPIKIIHQVSRAELNKWYAKASIYWHATGFGVDQTQYPEKMEHFGISTVEAMASGAVPVVINQGGQPEVLGAELQELLWNDQSDCLAKTMMLMNNKEQRQELARQAQVRAQQFSPEQFENQLRTMMQKLELI